MMLWWTPRERLTLGVLLAAAAIAGMLNLLRQHQQIVRVQVEHPPAEAATWDAALESAQHVSLNRASAAELERLPRIGPVLAERIVTYRTAHGPFTDVDQLSVVPGIGPTLIAELREYLTL